MSGSGFADKRGQTRSAVSLSLSLTPARHTPPREEGRKRRIRAEVKRLGVGLAGPGSYVAPAWKQKGEARERARSAGAARYSQLALYSSGAAASCAGGLPGHQTRLRSSSVSVFT